MNLRTASSGQLTVRQRPSPGRRRFVTVPDRANRLPGNRSDVITRPWQGTIVKKRIKKAYSQLCWLQLPGELSVVATVYLAILSKNIKQSPSLNHLRHTRPEYFKTYVYQFTVEIPLRWCFCAKLKTNSSFQLVLLGTAQHRKRRVRLRVSVHVAAAVRELPAPLGGRATLARLHVQGVQHLHRRRVRLHHNDAHRASGSLLQR